MMQAVVISNFGGVEQLELQRLAKPVAGPGQLLVRVRAAGINRADIIQRQGFYPSPPGASPLLGLEIAGEVEDWAPGVTGFARGERVFGLVPGGGYATHACLDSALAHKTPAAWSDVFAAAIVETFYTANEGLFEQGQLRRGERVLVQGGSSGVGTSAIQLAAHFGAEVFATVGSAEKAERLHELGCTHRILYREQAFETAIREITGGEGVDLILDLVGGNLAGNLDCLRAKGRLILVGMIAGRKGEVSLGTMIRNRLTIKGIVLRSLSLAEKIAIRERFVARCWLPLLAGELKPIVHASFPLERVRDAHSFLEASQHLGKLVLTMP